MNAPARLAAFAAAAAVAFGVGFGIGDAAGPFDDERPEPATGHDVHEEQP